MKSFRKWKTRKYEIYGTPLHNIALYSVARITDLSVSSPAIKTVCQNIEFLLICVVCFINN